MPVGLHTCSIRGCLCVLALLLAPGLSAAPEVRICYESNAQPPYYLGTDHVPLTNPGYDIELVGQAVAQLGLKAQFYRRSWKRCIDDLKSGRADALQAMIWTPERERWAAFPKDVAGNPDPTRHLGEGVYRIYVSRGSGLTWDGERFTGVHYGIGAPLGYISYQRLQDLGVLSDQILDQAEGLEQVARGRLDGYVMDQVLALGLIKQLELGAQLMPLPQPLFKKAWYLVFSPEFYRAYPEAAEGIWTALGERRLRDGDALLQKYLLLD